MHRPPSILPDRMTVVTIQMAPQPQPPRDRHLLEACERAFARGACTWNTAERDATVPAVVQWDGGGTVEISVGHGRAARKVRLVFASNDPDNERYKAIGYAIGSGARSVLEEAEGRSAPEPPTSASASMLPTQNKPLPLPTADSLTGPRRRFELHAEPQFSLAPLGQPLYGGSLGLAATLDGHWSAVIAGRYRLSTGDDEGYAVHSMQALLGIGYGWHSGVMGVELRSGLALDWLQASIRPPAPRLARNQSSAAFGGFVEALFWIAPERVVSGQIGVGVVARPPILVQVDGEVKRQLDVLELSAGVGLRVRIW